MMSEFAVVLYVNTCWTGVHHSIASVRADTHAEDAIMPTRPMDAELASWMQGSGQGSYMRDTMQSYPFHSLLLPPPSKQLTRVSLFRSGVRDCFMPTASALAKWSQDRLPPAAHTVYVYPRRSVGRLIAPRDACARV